MFATTTFGDTAYMSAQLDPRTAYAPLCKGATESSCTRGWANASLTKSRGLAVGHTTARSVQQRVEG